MDNQEYVFNIYRIQKDAPKSGPWAKQHFIVTGFESLQKAKEAAQSAVKGTIIWRGDVNAAYREQYTDSDSSANPIWADWERNASGPDCAGGHLIEKSRAANQWGVTWVSVGPATYFERFGWWDTQHNRYNWDWYRETTVKMSKEQWQGAS